MKEKISPKVIIIGIDGGTFDLINPWVKEGKLPNFEHLMAKGLWGDLTSTIPPVTAPAWTSFMTGQNPGNHGLFHFIEPKPDTYEFRYTNALSHNSKTVWKLLSENNIKVGVINVPMTYPPEPVNGYMISGMDTPDEDCRFTYPVELKDELKKVFGEIKFGVKFLGGLRTDKRKEEYLDEVIKIEDRITDITLYLMEKYPTDITMLVYRSTDQVQHLFWHYMDKSHPNFDPSGAEQYGSTIYRIYKKLDENIGRLMENISEDTSVILMSDHGFGPTSGTVLYLNKYLEKLGALKFKHNNKSAAMRISSYLTRYADNFLRGFFPSDLKAKLIKIFPSLFKKWQSYSTGLSAIDWANTKAFCYELLTFPPAIWINKKGLWPFGIVSEEEYPKIIAFLKEKLYSLKHPQTGESLIKKVYEKNEIYNSQCFAKAPDLTIDWWSEKGIIYTPTISPNGGEFICDITGKRIVTGSEWTGTHRLNGMALFNGKQFNKGVFNNDIHITDLAPALLYLLRAPIPHGMDGKVPMSIFDSNYIKENPINYITGELSKVNEDRETYTDDETAKIEEKLRNLGYIS